MRARGAEWLGRGMPGSDRRPRGVQRRAVGADGGSGVARRNASAARAADGQGSTKVGRVGCASTVGQGSARNTRLHLRNSCATTGAAVKPLAGKKILVGRAAKQASALSDLLREQGAKVTEIPFIEIRRPKSFRPLDRALRNLTKYDWLVLTSVNGVEVFFSRLEKTDSADLSGLQVAAIGPATRDAIEREGLRVQVMPREYVAESVVKALRGKVRGKRVLLVRAKVARDVIPRELRKAGARVDVVEAYHTVVPKASAGKLQRLLADSKRRPDAITFTSSSTARNFVKLAGKSSLKGILLASIGPVTSATLRESGLKPHAQAREYTMTGLVSALKKAFVQR